MRRALSLAVLVGAAACGSVPSNQCAEGFHFDYVGECEANCTAGSCDATSTCNLATGVCEYQSCYHLDAAFPGLPPAGRSIRPVASEPSLAVFCAGGWSYEAVGFGSFVDDLGPGYAGWEQLTVSHLQSSFAQQAFIATYNQQGGLRNLDVGGTGAQCCVKSAYDGVLDLKIATSGVTPANLDGTVNCGGPYTDTTLRFAVGGPVVPTPLSDGAFSGGVTSGMVCDDDDNPAFMVRRRTGLRSCQAIADANLSEGSGIYLVDHDGLGPDLPSEVVCDMATGTTIRDIGVGTATGVYPEYDLMTELDFADEDVQRAFLLFYGRAGGFTNLDLAMTVTDCCVALAGGTTFLAFGGSPVTISPFGGGACTGTLADPQLGFAVGGGATEPPPLRRDYFTALPPSAITTCTGGGNPALFIRRE